MNNLTSVKCNNCSKRLFDIYAVGTVEIKCPKCGKIIKTNLEKDTIGKIVYTQEIA